MVQSAKAYVWRAFWMLSIVLASRSMAWAVLYTPHCLGACPLGSPDTNTIIVRSIYTLSSNGATKLSDWVAYVVDANDFGPSRARVWRADPLIATNETLVPEDYRGAYDALGTDRGHQAPLASFAGHEDWADTNYLSNITPQSADLNQGSWMRLESAVRAFAEAGEQRLFVVTGPLYEKAMPSLPGTNKPHWVPSGYWKIVASESGLTAFIMPQEAKRSDDFCGYETTVEEVTRRTGLHFSEQLMMMVDPLPFCTDSIVTMSH